MKEKLDKESKKDMKKTRDPKEENQRGEGEMPIRKSTK